MATDEELSELARQASGRDLEAAKRLVALLEREVAPPAASSALDNALVAAKASYAWMEPEDFAFLESADRVLGEDLGLMLGVVVGQIARRGLGVPGRNSWEADLAGDDQIRKARWLEVNDHLFATFGLLVARAAAKPGMDVARLQRVIEAIGRIPSVMSMAAPPRSPFDALFGLRRSP